MSEIKIESPLKHKYSNSKKLTIELLKYYLENTNGHYVNPANIYLYIPNLIHKDNTGAYIFDFTLWSATTLDCIKNIEEKVLTYYKDKYGELNRTYTYVEITSFVNEFVRKVKDHVSKATVLYSSEIEKILKEILGDKVVERPKEYKKPPMMEELEEETESEQTPTQEISSPEPIKSDETEFNAFDIEDFLTIIKNSCKECLDILGLEYKNFVLSGINFETHKGQYQNVYLTFEFECNKNFESVEVKLPYKYKHNVMFIKGAFYTTVNNLFDKE